MDGIEVFLRLAFMGLALLMLGMTLASFARTREAKLALASGGFGALAAEGLVLGLGVFAGWAEDLVSIQLIIGLNLLALVLIYLSFLKR